MKWLSLFVVLVGDYVMATFTDLFEALCLAVFILAFGIVIKVASRKKRNRVNAMAWGMVYGSIVSVLVLVGFGAWLYFNFPAN
jgi:uncharacterized membrane protein